MSIERVAEIHENGYCVLRQCLPKGVVDACREAAWPVMLKHIGEGGRQANRGSYRHFLPMRFEPDLSTGWLSHFPGRVTYDAIQRAVLLSFRVHLIKLSNALADANKSLLSVNKP
jgi:hypothetical protein